MEDTHIIHLLVEAGTIAQNKIVLKLEHSVKVNGEEEINLAVFEFQGRTYRLASRSTAAQADEPPALEPIVEDAPGRVNRCPICGDEDYLYAAVLRDMRNGPPPYLAQNLHTCTTDVRQQGLTLPDGQVTVTNVTENPTGDNAGKSHIDMDFAPGERSIVRLHTSSTPHTYTWHDRRGQPRLVVEHQGRGLMHVRCGNPGEHILIPKNMRFILPV